MATSRLLFHLGEEWIIWQWQIRWTGVCVGRVLISIPGWQPLELRIKQQFSCRLPTLNLLAFVWLLSKEICVRDPCRSLTLFQVSPATLPWIQETGSNHTACRNHWFGFLRSQSLWVSLCWLFCCFWLTVVDPHVTDWFKLLDKSARFCLEKGKIVHCHKSNPYWIGRSLGQRWKQYKKKSTYSKKQEPPP